MELSFSCCYRLFNLAFLSLPWKLFKNPEHRGGTLGDIDMEKVEERKITGGADLSVVCTESVCEDVTVFGGATAR